MSHIHKRGGASSSGQLGETLVPIIDEFVECYIESTRSEKPSPTTVSHLNKTEASMMKNELSRYIALLVDSNSDEESVTLASKQITRTLLSVGVSVDWLLKMISEAVEILRSASSKYGVDSEVVNRAASLLEAGFASQILVILDAERHDDEVRFLEIEELAQITQRATSTSHLMKLLLESLIKSEGIAGAYFGHFNLEGQLEYDHVAGETFVQISRLASEKKIPPPSSRPDLPAGGGPAGRAWRSGEIQVSAAIQSDPTMAPWSEAYS